MPNVRGLFHIYQELALRFAEQTPAPVVAVCQAAQVNVGTRA